MIWLFMLLLSVVAIELVDIFYYSYNPVERMLDLLAFILSAVAAWLLVAMNWSRIVSSSFSLITMGVVVAALVVGVILGLMMHPG